MPNLTRPGLGPLHTHDWEHVTITLQALSLVEKAEPIHVRFILRSRDQRSMGMQDECKSLRGFQHGIKWNIFHGLLDYIQKPPLGGRPNTNRETIALPMFTTVDLSYFILVWGPTWIEIHWNSIWLRPQSHMASHYTWGSMTTLHDFGSCLRTAFGHFLLGSHNLMVTARGSCVKWPLDCFPTKTNTD
jgi:hypothetical protein